MTEGGSPDLTNTYSNSKPVDKIYEIVAMTRLMIFSVKVSLVPLSNVSEKNQ